ncbi:MAG: sulfatase-like hydrolase/transferase [Planctomycetaceae bacterium]
MTNQTNPTSSPASASRRTFVKQLSAGMVSSLLAGPRLLQSAESEVSKKPNLLFICTDQQHWEALGSVDSFFDTPAMDKLAAAGTRFDQTYCTTPQCSPSRSSLLTGFYPSTTTVYNNTDMTGGNHLAQETIGHHLRAAGYETAYFGKWHLGDDSTANAGWDERKINITDPEVTELGLAYLQKKHEQVQQQPQKPFALFLMYINPHDIYDYRPEKDVLEPEEVALPDSWHQDDLSTKPSVQKRFMTHNQGWVLHGQKQKYWEEYHQYYRYVVKKVDTEIGRILDKLDETGLTDSTCRFVTSDHGDMDTHHRLIYKGPFMYEQMVHVPFIASIPDQFKTKATPAVSNDFMLLTDVVPTLVDFAGGRIPECHGKSLKPFLTGTGSMPKRDYVVSHYYGKQNWINPIRMIRTKEFKYNRYIEHGEELYDLRNDPGEIVNLAGQAKYADVQQQLKSQLDEWIREHEDPFTRSPRMIQRNLTPPSDVRRNCATKLNR